PPRQPRGGRLGRRPPGGRPRARRRLPGPPSRRPRRGRAGGGGRGVPGAGGAGVHRRPRPPPGRGPRRGAGFVRTAGRGAGAGEPGLMGPDPIDPTGDPEDWDALEPIIALVSPPGERGHLVEGFARAVLRRVPATELADADPVSTGVALVDAFDFVDGRPPGEIRVRLVDPRVSVDGWHSTGTVVQVNCEDRQFIVTTVKEELHRLGHKVTRLL